jgi:hypothetical protein
MAISLSFLAPALIAATNPTLETKISFLQRTTGQPIKFQCSSQIARCKVPFAQL